MADNPLSPDEESKVDYLNTPDGGGVGGPADAASFDAGRAKEQFGAGGPPEKSALSETERRNRWSSVIDSMVQQRAEFPNIVPYFALYGQKTSDTDHRVAVIRGARKRGNYYFVAITSDGPFKLDLNPLDPNANFPDLESVNAKLREDAQLDEPIPGSGYFEEIVGDDVVSRTINLGDMESNFHFRFSWSSEIENHRKADPVHAPPATLFRLDSSTTIDALRLARSYIRDGETRPYKYFYDIQPVIDLLQTTSNDTGVPETNNNVDM